MERKIGEIFEYNGEWYQCVESQDGSCKHCDMNFEGKCPIPIKECTESGRSDKSYVIFKKLEKVGEPKMINGRMVQKVKQFKANGFVGCCLLNNGICLKKYADCHMEEIYVEIKQNKEDMEEKKLNLKPFDIQKAREGKPVCTRDGRKVRIISCSLMNKNFPIAAIVEGEEENVYQFEANGVCDEHDENLDLMMLPEKKEGWINIYDADTTFRYVDGRVYETKDEAVQEAKEEVEKEQREKNEYIDTIRVEWEE